MWASLRRIAQDMGYRSWSSVTWHLAHLERAGLIRRYYDDKYRERRIHMIPCTEAQAADRIARVPRIPWPKIRKEIPKTKMRLDDAGKELIVAEARLAETEKKPKRSAEE